MTLTNFDKVLGFEREGRRGDVGMKWKHNPMLDTLEAETKHGRFLCVRTWCNVSVLYFNGTEIARDAKTGGHLGNIKRAEAMYEGLCANA